MGRRSPATQNVVEEGERLTPQREEVGNDLGVGSTGRPQRVVDGGGGGV